MKKTHKNTIIEVKQLKKDAFNVIRFGNDTDFSTLDAISQELDKQGIKHILLSDNFDIKTLAAKDKLELLEYIKKEIGLEDKTDSLIIHQDATVEVVLRTTSDTKLQFNDLVIEYKSKDNCVHVTYDVKDSQYVSDNLKKIKLASNHLLTLINDILDISKVERGNISLSPVTFSIVDSAENLVNISQPTVRQKNIDFRFRSKNIKYEYLYADQLRINQIFIKEVVY